MNVTKFALIALLAAAAPAAFAVTIPVDLGPRQNKVEPTLQIPFNLGFSNFTGQTLDLDIAFTNSEFLALYPLGPRRRKPSLEISPVLTVTGDGTLQFPTASVYTVGAHGVQNSPAENSGGGYVVTDGTETFRFSLGYIFPYFILPADTKFPFDIYGLHFHLTLPDNPDFQIDSARLFIGGSNSSAFGIGPWVPEGSDDPAALLTVGLAGLVGLTHFVSWGLDVRDRHRRRG